MKDSKDLSLLLKISLLLLFLSSFKTILFAGDLRLILSTSDKGLLISEDDGKIWEDFNDGLPGRFMPERIEADSRQNLYLTTRHRGIYRYRNDKGRWIDFNTKNFLANSFPDSQDGYRSISAIATGGKNPGTIALATKHSIFKKGKGKDWQRISDKVLKNYITALAVGRSDREIYAGTSYDGLYRLEGGRFIKCSSGLPREPYTKDFYFYEEISEIAIDERDSNIIYAGLNFGGGVFISRNRGRSWGDLVFPVSKETFFNIYDLKTDDQSLYVSSSAGIFRMDLESKTWHKFKFDYILNTISNRSENLSILIFHKSNRRPPIFYKVREHRVQKDKDFSEKASNKKAIYASIPSVRKRLADHVRFINQSDLNAIVIDMKDDFGDLRYPSTNKTGMEIGAIKRPVKIDRILETLRENNIYTIARIVVFKDERLFKAYGEKYAIWDRKKERPWKGNPREYWVDPYSDFVRSYNTDIAAELQKIGFDEIQFDYIRFPSDGPVGRCLYRYKWKDDIYKSEILSRFLREAKESIDIPISVDVYGYNAWYRFGNCIGQDVSDFAGIVDVVCPMVYPSHFGKRFYMNGPLYTRSYRVVHDSGKRAGVLIGKNALVRPYLQAFNLFSPTFGAEYIDNQIRGAMNSGCHGYTFWNSRGVYKTVKKAFLKFPKK